MTAPLLVAQDLSKRYGKVTVLDSVSIDVVAGEIHALIGANGAGKSTLCKILSGLVARSGGEIVFDAKAYDPRSKQDAESVGIEIVQQELNLIPTLSVAENLMLTRLPNRLGVIRRGELFAHAAELLARVGMQDVDPHAPVQSLGIGRQQMVEIASTLGRHCKLLILDEPTAALSGREAGRLFEWLARLRQSGVGIIYISHRLDEIKRLADRVTVLRDGKRVVTRSAETLSTDEMIRLMSGDGLASSHAVERPTRRLADTVIPAALRVENLTCGPVRDVSFTVGRGEIFGITGLIGSGRTELLRAIYGADRGVAGSVFVGDDPTPRRFRHPGEAVAAGLAMVTEDRKQSGLLLSKSVVINATLSSLWKRFSCGGWLRTADERDATLSMCERLEVRCADIDQAVATLSGGNQQKVFVSKWLVRDAEVFLFDEPTRGIDIAARRLIYRLMDSLAQAGKGLVIVSSDLEELFETCDRIAVMSSGRLTGTFTRGDWSREKIMQASFVGHRDEALVRHD
jgi:ribose transport system ATP-binding protein